ncbi:MAG TPA: DUF4097 family beta strand repeat-containing protein [Gemmatimonadaceae bacterium]|nr:DUF4097 family beta strand repeat-containing protein [Gemmatimonadaceae bacterium]
MSRQFAVLLLAIPFALAACMADSGPRHTDPNAFSWTGSVPAGKTLFLRNVTGGIKVMATDSPTVHVQASKSWRGSGDGNVRIVQREVADGVVICTLVGDAGDCSPSSYSTDGPKGNRTIDLRDLLGHGKMASVDYVVTVPNGVRVNVITVSGGIGMADVTGPVKAETVNGKVQVAARSGPVTASSVNGSVTVAIDSLGEPGDIELSTVNGSVTAQLPPSLAAQLSMETVNGSVQSDFDVAGRDTSERKEIHGTIAGGGRRVALETVNGSVKLLRGT